jgi:FADH2 O2-dependent halogenase
LSPVYDIAIAGSGFAGSLFAMIATRLGFRVVLLERGSHPRFAIGESSTPLSNILLEELALKYDLSAIRPLAKWGSWQHAHPELPCGLKRGFTFLHHAPGQASLGRGQQLLVAASPHNAIADTHWLREDFDHFLINEAQRLGVDYLDHIDLAQFTSHADTVTLSGHRHGQPINIEARFVIDATGPRGFLQNILRLGERSLPDYPLTQAIYSHFSGVSRLDDLYKSEFPGHPPYPVDSAAIHHIFNGGWVWVLHFNNGITSAGIAATDDLARSLVLSEGEPAWQRVLYQFPVLKNLFAHAKPVQPFRYIPRLSFRSARIVGPNWALLPSAAGFVDPLLSTGFPLTLLGISRLAQIIECDWASGRIASSLHDYAAKTDAELLASSRLISALFANMENFPAFASLSLLYFAAASYAETARRLGKPHLASSFLLHDHPQFGPACVRILDRAQTGIDSRESASLAQQVLNAIEPIDVAGLSRAGHNNWYPVDAQDLFAAAHKVNASHNEIAQMLDRAGFYAPTSSVPAKS